MGKLPKTNVLAYNGFKSTPTLEKQMTGNISNLFSEGDFVRHYLTDTRQLLSFPYLSHHTNEVNHRIQHSDPCLPCSTNEESNLIGSSEDSPSSSVYINAETISADVKVPPPSNSAPSIENSKHLLFSSSSSSDSEIGEDEIIILHSSRCPLGKAWVQRIKKI
ncbi:hypothetical protein NPIL_57771 [Nephila pilipes]|uniref:Uncharacterized protein n=1 Tax=Nephila pilipes TaxID=299642 RepID=A0A8X6QXM0_NEPPI|nr:hypothetical protein NPIL_57771 [Nephila pilipes]